MNPRAAQPLRVLALTAHEPWPLSHGGRLHMHHVLRELAPATALTLALPSTPQHREQLPRPMRVITIDDADRLASPPADWPVRLAARHFGWSPALATWLSQNATPDRYDVVLLHGASLGQYAVACHTPVVWNLQDELLLPTLRALRWQAWRDRPATLRAALVYALFEAELLRRVAATVLVSRVDARWARWLAPFSRLAVIENGVDLTYFASTGGAAPHPTGGVVTFVGALDFPPNIEAMQWFVSHVWSRLYGGGAARRLVVVGRDPTPSVRTVCRVAGVELHANVPDVRPYLHASDIVIAPIRQGGGLKNKILEACAAGKPVIASPQALGGLQAVPGSELVVARSPREWVARLSALLTDPDAARRIGTNAQRWVRTHHDWAHTGRRFLALLHAAAGRHRTRVAAAPDVSAGGAPCH